MKQKFKINSLCLTNSETDFVIDCPLCCRLLRIDLETCEKGPVFQPLIEAKKWYKKTNLELGLLRWLKLSGLY